MPSFFCIIKESSQFVFRMETIYFMVTISFFLEFKSLFGYM